MKIVLSGRRDGTTHREVSLLASLPEELRLIGGLAVMCRVGTPHRATVDLDAVARNLPQYHPEIARMALTSTGGGQYRFAGNLDLDVIDVAAATAHDLAVELSEDGELSDLELNVVAHSWAHDSTTPLDIIAIDDESGLVLARADNRLVASSAGIVAMKATTVGLRASSKPEKRASDLYDLGRVLIDGGIKPADIAAMPELLLRPVSALVHRWFVDEGGRDRTYRDVRRFDEPRLDLDNVSDAVQDLFD